MAHEKNHDYHILPPSPWPFYGAVAGFFMLVGLILGFKGEYAADYWLALLGFVAVCYVAYGWWSDVVVESRVGDHTPVVQIGLRYGVILFIISEVMFFSAWFWSFFKHAIFPMEAATLDGVVPTAEALDGIWPPAGIETFNPWDLPLLNTVILLLSGCTVTYAHHCLIENRRDGLVWGLIGTVGLGALFTIFQAYEYSHSPFGFTDGIYAANFYMATGFHGFHVLVGTIFLAVCLFRAQSGQFRPEKHIGFEAAAWYWHFVDVVWLFLFASIYIWGR
ncbi:MAG: cytochrome c oxidase subunit 3 [Pseudomonadota bacterium]